jgi:PST family polysaccharide transporter
MSLLRKTAISTAWSFTGQQVTSVLALATSVVAARILSPGDLGRYALASVITSLAASPAALNSWGYYVISEQPSRRLLRTGVTLELAIGAVVFALICAGSAGYRELTGDTEFALLLIVEAVVMFTNPFVALQGPDRRSLSYRAPTTVQTAGFTVGCLSKVALLLAGTGVFALAIGDVVVSLAVAIGFLIAVPDGRGLMIDRPLAREILRFGIPSTFTAALNQLTSRAQEFIVAGFLGTRQLGFFYLATRWPQQFQQIGQSLSLGLLPAFSKTRGAQLERGYATTTRLSAFLVAVPLALAFPLAAPFVKLVYGAQWAPAAWPLVLLVGAMAIRFVFWHAYNLLKSRNRVREMTVVTALQVVLYAAATVIGALVGGLVGVGVGAVIAEAALVLPKVRLIKSVVPFSAVRLLSQPIVAVIVAGSCVALVTSVLSATPALIAGSAVGLTIITLVAWWSDRVLVSEVAASFRRAPNGA